jgi:hypothetical protein
MAGVNMKIFIIKEKNIWIYLTFFSPSNLAGNIATQFVYDISMQKCYPSYELDMVLQFLILHWHKLKN